MPTIELKAEVSVDALLAGVEQLPTPYLEDFVAKALAVQAKRRAKSLNKGESLLLEKINRGIPDTIHAHTKNWSKNDGMKLCWRTNTRSCCLNYSD